MQRMELRLAADAAYGHGFFGKGFESLSQPKCYRAALASVLIGARFDLVFSFVIVVDSVLLGVVTDARVYGLDPEHSVFRVSEASFLLVYSPEVYVRNPTILHCRVSVVGKQSRGFDV